MQARSADWPDPVEVLNETSDAGIVLICDHASNHIPAEYRSLGLSAADLQRHIAWDIGAASVTRDLAAALTAPAFLGRFSRLLVDLNRPLGVPTSVPCLSENTAIPGNRGLGERELARRRERIFDPFHARIAAVLDRRQAAGVPTRIAAIHSFTPVFRGEARPWHVGILYDVAADYAARVVAALRADPDLLVGENVPYEIHRDEDYAVPVHGADRGIAALLVEIRNDLIADRAGIQSWTDRLAKAL